MFFNKSKLTKILTSGRSNNYFWEKEVNNQDNKKDLSDKKNYCLLTLWGLTHFLLYFVFGLITPKLFWVAMVVSVLFEYYENLEWDCHDVLDVFINTLGLVSGTYLNRILRK